MTNPDRYYDRQRLTGALTVLRWGSSQTAGELGVRNDTVAKWLTGRSQIPPAVLAWIEGLAAAHARFVAENPRPKSERNTTNPED